jgi:hypothetical protein
MLSHNVLATEFMITFPKVSKVNQNNVWRMVTAVICLVIYYGFFHQCNLFGLCHFHLCHAKLVVKKKDDILMSYNTGVNVTIKIR